ncbi:hypothetical protein Psuf_079060 [Phytohabitans suffuscus]|uniref:Uncharacterized protein n=1 Tax=Phytohabitans suffuscus TaxID=624315 RepID=A0A6F8YX66_9ACTN|nr:hypothetical protein Psuf_079060 [Phytohabitans suffuscus]
MDRRAPDLETPAMELSGSRSERIGRGGGRWFSDVPAARGRRGRPGVWAAEGEAAGATAVTTAGVAAARIFCFCIRIPRSAAAPLRGMVRTASIKVATSTPEGL